MKKILITSGLSVMDVGGPAKYAPNLTREFNTMGHSARYISFGLERKLPFGFRHLVFFFRILPHIIWCDCVITLDTVTVGIPSVAAAKLFGKRAVVRIGGDFLWETYVNRTGEKRILSSFYKCLPKLSMKEKFILHFTKWLVREANVLVFVVEWLRHIWQNPYKLEENRVAVVRNFVPNRQKAETPVEKNIVWAGRRIGVKNLDTLQEVIGSIKDPKFRLDIIDNLSHKELMNKLKRCYAVILPSLSDVCPNFVLEAISFRKPFIVTRETGLGEIYDKGGIFVDPLDKDKMVEAVMRVLDDREYDRFINDIDASYINRSWSEVAKEFISIC